MTYGNRTLEGAKKVLSVIMKNSS